MFIITFLIIIFYSIAIHLCIVIFNFVFTIFITNKSIKAICFLVVNTLFCFSGIIKTITTSNI
ncbi:Uncharacterised protein [Mycobacterium tuberculosis]|nr:Uncharacterised protein [Mycobacterium tuberculosis]